MPDTADTYLTTAELADCLKISARTLERMRLEGRGPKFTKLGRRVVYAESAVSQFVAANTFASTSEATR